MTLLKLKDFDPNYKETWETEGLQGFDVYTDVADEKIGNVNDLLVDEQGRFRYLIVDLGFWKFGKSVLASVGRCRVNEQAHRVYLMGFTKEQAENLPEFSDQLKIDNDYEPRVRGVYRPPSQPQDRQRMPLENSVPLESPYETRQGTPLELRMQQRPAQLEQIASTDAAEVNTRGYTLSSGDAFDRNLSSQPNYSQEQQVSTPHDLDDDSFYELDEKDHLILRLYQERLQARRKRGL